MYMRTWAALAATISLCRSAQADLISLRQPPIAFFWATRNDTIKTIPQCGSLQLFTMASPTTNVQPTVPLYFTAAASGYQPETQLASESVGGAFTWTANYPVGTQLLFAMTDSANNSGGAVDGYTVIPGSDNCTLRDGAESPISFSVYPDSRPCSEIAFDVEGGERPYTVSIFVPGTGAYLNASDIDETSFSIQNTIPAGQSYTLWISDSVGATSLVAGTQTSQLNQAGCNAAIRPDGGSSMPVGTVVGAVIGSVLGALLIAGAAWWFVRRRNRQRAEQYRKQPPAATTEYRTPDGRAPLVEPFRIPMVGAGAVAGAETGEDYSPNAESFEKGLYPLSADQHFARSAQPSAGVVPAPLAVPNPLYDPAANPYAHSYDTYDHPSYTPSSSAAVGTAGHGSGSAYDPLAPSAADTAEYLSPSGPSTAYKTDRRQPPPSSSLDDNEQHSPVGDGTDGLAHPEEFEYRLPGDSPTGTGALPWAHQSQGPGASYGRSHGGWSY